ncbi:MAG: hypothetical protein H7X91_13225 [Burkholderiales bacterium]|nr:hypothetical protein [Burkholderiales bacterium]
MHALMFVILVIGMLYSLYLCYLGVRTVLRIRASDAQMLLGIVLFCLLLLSPAIGYLAGALGFRIS